MSVKDNLDTASIPTIYFVRCRLSELKCVQSLLYILALLLLNAWYRKLWNVKMEVKPIIMGSLVTGDGLRSGGTAVKAIR